MQKLSKEQWIKLIEKQLGNWESKVGKPEDNKFHGGWWAYIHPRDKQKKALTRYFFTYGRVPEEFDQFKQEVEDFEKTRPYGEGLLPCQFVKQYLLDCLEMLRLHPDMDGPFDWEPIYIAPEHKELYEKLRAINLEISLCLSGGIGSAFERVYMQKQAVESILRHPCTGEDWIGWKQPTLNEWEKHGLLLWCTK